jgi:hypothetical protein
MQTVKLFTVRCEALRATGREAIQVGDQFRGGSVELSCGLLWITRQVGHGCTEEMKCNIMLANRMQQFRTGCELVFSPSTYRCFLWHYSWNHFYTYILAAYDHSLAFSSTLYIHLLCFFPSQWVELLSCWVLSVALRLRPWPLWPHRWRFVTWRRKKLQQLYYYILLSLKTIINNFYSYQY